MYNSPKHFPHSLLFVCIQDEKNQVLMTNAWLQLVGSQSESNTSICACVAVLLKFGRTAGVKLASLCRSTGRTSTWAGIQKNTLESRTWGSPQTRFGPQTYSCTTGQSCCLSLSVRSSEPMSFTAENQRKRSQRVETADFYTDIHVI